MLKNNKGVTLTALVITVIVMGILISVSLSSGKEILLTSKLKKYITIMELIRGKTETIYESYEFDMDQSRLLGDYINPDVAKSSFQSVYNKEILTGTLSTEEREKREKELEDVNWYKLEASDLYSMGIETDLTKNNGVFFVNYKYGVIIYSKGYKSGNDIFYSLEKYKELNEKE